jgi:hypothetical protein
MHYEETLILLIRKWWISVNIIKNNSSLFLPYLLNTLPISAQVLC